MINRKRLTLLLLFAVLAGSTREAVAGDPCEGDLNTRLEALPDTILAPGYVASFVVGGAARAPVSLAADVGEGPTEVPGIGTLCLEASPSLRVIFNGIEEGFPLILPDGQFEFSLEIPPRRHLGNRSFFLQGAIADPDAPDGFAITPQLQLDVLDAIVENFGRTESQDPVTTNAAWDGDGFLRGRVTNPRQVDFAPKDTGFLLADPLRSKGSRFQMLYPNRRMRFEPGESILALSWGPKSNFVFASRYSDLEIKLGHAAGSSLLPEFDSNYSPDGPQQVYRGDYELPNSLNSNWFPWPEFETDFEWREPSPGLILEIGVPPGGDTFQIFRNQFTDAPVNRRIIAPFGADRSPHGPEDTLYHARFTVAKTTTIAQSVFYDSGISDPDYLVPRVTARTLPEGTSFELELEGAEDDDENGIPDPGSATGFHSDADRLDGSRLVRFRITLKGNPRSGRVPVLDAVSLAFRPPSTQLE